MKTQLTVLLLATLLFASCKKNKVEDVSPPPNCRLIEQIMHLSISGYDYTLKYSYTDNKISRIDDSRDQYFTFEYAGGRLSRKNYFFENQPNPYAYELIHYNADSTVSSIERYRLKDNQSNAYEKWDEAVFAYAGGRITGVTNFLWGAGVSNKHHEFVYTYTGNNITKVDFIRHFDSGTGYTYSLTYDNLENHIRKRGVLWWLYTSVWDEYYGSFINGDGIARAQGANNATTSWLGSTLYTPDENQNLSVVWRNNQVDEKYIYECP